MKKKVLNILPSFFPGGAERLTTHLLLRLNRSRYEVAAASLFGRQGTDMEAMLDQAGVRVWFLGKRRGFDPKMYWRLSRVFREFQPDIVHTHMIVLRYLLHLLLGGRERVWVHTVHNIDDKEMGRRGRPVYRAAFRISALLGMVPVALAEEVARSVKRIYGLKDVPIIPNAIPVDDYARGASVREAWRTREGYGREEVLLVSVARMYPQKDHASLIKAFALVASRDDRLRLLLAGDGPLRPKLEALVRELGLVSRVRFLGVRTDVPEILGAADIFVLSSLWEGNPLAVMEAMAAGRLVIATAVGGVHELIEDGVSGFLIPPGDIDALSKAIWRLAMEPGLRERVGRAASQRARERFDVIAVTREYEALYERLLERRGNR